jgi:hypothetical protein
LVRWEVHNLTQPSKKKAFRVNRVYPKILRNRPFEALFARKNIEDCFMRRKQQSEYLLDLADVVVAAKDEKGKVSCTNPLT